jgi:hypothetical protein
VKVDDDDACLPPDCLDLSENDRKRIIERGHEDPPHDVDHRHRLAAPRAPDPGAAARSPGGEVGGAKKPRLPRNVVEDLFLVPDVVARRHHVDAVAQDSVGDVSGHAEAGGGVFDVGNHQVDAVLGDQRRDRALGDLAPRLAEDVADEEDLHSVGSDRDADLAAAAFVDARQDDLQHTGPERGARPPGVDRATNADSQGEATERPFGQVEFGVGVTAHRRPLGTGDQQRAFGKGDLDPVGRDPWQIDQHFDRGRRLEHVNRRRALRWLPRRQCLAFEEVEQSLQFVPHIPTFHMDPEHWPDCTSASRAENALPGRDNSQARVFLKPNSMYLMQLHSYNMLDRR